MANESKVQDELTDKEIKESWEQTAERARKAEELESKIMAQMDRLSAISDPQELSELEAEILSLSNYPMTRRAWEEATDGIDATWHEWLEQVRRHPLYQDYRIGEWGMKRLDWLLEIAPDFRFIQDQIWDLIFHGALAAYLNKFDRIMRLRIENQTFWLKQFDLPENSPQMWMQVGNDLTCMKIKEHELKADKATLEYAMAEFQKYPYLLTKEQPIPANPEDPEETYELSETQMEAIERAMTNPTVGKRAFMEWAKAGGLIQDQISETYLSELESELEETEE